MAVNVDKSIVYKASQAKSDATAFWKKTNDKKAEEILNLIYSGIKTSFTTGSKTFNQTDMMLGTKDQYLNKAETILTLVKSNLVSNGYAKDNINIAITTKDNNVTSASITIEWSTNE